jgi:hypothetical protein
MKRPNIVAAIVLNMVVVVIVLLHTSRIELMLGRVEWGGSRMGFEVYLPDTLQNGFLWEGKQIAQ